jgi:eukaryotic-like serine/threonine-protein kinase
MGDALTGGDVRKLEELDTVDGTGTAESAPPAAVAPRPIGGTDYSELVAVDRRHYLIGGELAKGGMGRVLEARDLRLGRDVAIKEMLPKNRDAARQFEREARITARLQHPAIIHVYEAGAWVGGEPFYAMPKISGRSLDKVIAERTTLNDRLGLLPNVIAIADALAYAHNEKVIHRDLKPSNVLVGAFGQTVVIDWGLAKDLTVVSDPCESLELRARARGSPEQPPGVVGTPPYMPPEQARGHSVDQRADVYALGALLYHVLVGAAPYTGATQAAVIEQVKLGTFVPVREREPGAPADLVAIVDKAMARDPDDRYADAGELAQDLKRFQTGQLVAAHNYTAGQLFWRWVRRFRIPVTIAAAAIVILVLVAALFVSRIVEDKRQVVKGRRMLFEERGRTELLDRHAGRAAAYLVGAAHDGATGGAHRFLLAEALRPFAAERRVVDRFAMGTVAVAYSPDGEYIVTAGVGPAHVWTADGALVATLAGISGRTTVVAFDRNSARIVTGGDDGVARVWSRDGRWHVELHGHRGAIRDAVFDEQGARIATASDDGSARVWDLAKPGAPEFVLAINQAPVVSVRFSPDGNWLATASGDNTACIVSPHPRARWVTDPCDAPLRGHGGPLASIRWSPSGAYVVTASADGTARVWDAAAHGQWIKGKPVLAPLVHGGPVVSAEFSDDGGRILTASADGTARIYEVPAHIPPDDSTLSATELRAYRAADGLVGAVFGPGASTIATAEHDGHSTVWDAHTGRVIASFEHASAVDDVRFSPDGLTLLTASRDGTARLWDIAKADAAHPVYKADTSIHAVAIAPDRSLAAGCDDSRVLLLHEKSESTLRDHLGRVFAVAFAPDGRTLVSGGDDEDAYVFDVPSGKRVGELPGHSEGVHSIAFSQDGETVATAGGDAIVRLWSVRHRTRIGTLPFHSPLASLAFAGNALLGGIDEDGRVVLWRLHGAVAPSMRPQMSGPAQAIAFDRDGKRLVVSTSSDTRVFLLADDEPIEHIRLDGPFGDVSGVVFSHDGERVVTASRDGVVRIWDAENGKLLATRDAHGAAINALAISGDDLVWTGDEGGTVRAWDVHAEAGDMDRLDRFVKCHVPWNVDGYVVVPAAEQGDCDGQR